MTKASSSILFLRLTQTNRRQTLFCHFFSSALTDKKNSREGKTTISHSDSCNENQSQSCTVLSISCMYPKRQRGRIPSEEAGILEGLVLFLVEIFPQMRTKMRGEVKSPQERWPCLDSKTHRHTCCSKRREEREKWASSPFPLQSCSCRCRFGSSPSTINSSLFIFFFDMSSDSSSFTSAFSSLSSCVSQGESKPSSISASSGGRPCPEKVSTFLEETIRMMMIMPYMDCGTCGGERERETFKVYGTAP